MVQRFWTKLTTPSATSIRFSWPVASRNVIAEGETRTAMKGSWRASKLLAPVVLKIVQIRA